MSIITVYKLFCGLKNAKQPEKEQEKIRRLTAELSVLKFD